MVWLYVVLVIAILTLLYRFLNKSTPNTVSGGSGETVRPIKGVVAKVNDLKVGEMKECSLSTGKILLFRSEDQKFHATATKCSHYGVSLINGTFCDGRIRCPAHGACFNVETGDIEDYPGSDSIPSFTATIVGDDVVVTAPSSLLNTNKAPKAMKKRDTKNEQTIVIIGGGCTGSTCAEVLRQEGFTGRIVMINREKHNGYDRPKLSKNLNVPLDKIFLRPVDYYSKYDIEVINGVEVNLLDPETKTVTTKDGQSFKYDKCLISPGADPQRLKFIPGHDGKNIYPLRTIEDAHNIYAAVDQKDVLIVGSSFIGMEVASCIINRAKSVTVIGMEKVPFERVLGFEVGTYLQKFHEKLNVKFVLEAIVQEFVKENDVVVKVILKDGKGELPCDVLVLGAGVLPATSFIPNEKLNKERDGSIFVDEYLYTGKDGLYCGGDVAKYPWKYLPGMHMRIEHWGMAQIHGQVIAKNMIRGNVVKCENVPFFWTQQHSRSIKYAGHALKYDKVIVDNGGEEVNFDNPKFAAYYILNGKAIAICTMNRDPQSSQFAEILTAGIQLTEEQIQSSIEQTKSTTDLLKDVINTINKK